MSILIKNATIVNEHTRFTGSVFIEGKFIKQIIREGESLPNATETIDATGLMLIPGLIDDQVHFREPGLTQKADLYTESRAAVVGGITSFMEMPNTVPQATTVELLEEKYAAAAQKSIANYSFYIGTTNTNLDEIKKIDPKQVCGVKIFMGSSTGDMVVDNDAALEEVFKNVDMLIATHCEDDPMIKENAAQYKAQYGEDVPIKFHPIIRSREACIKSSSKAIELAKKHNARLHILHISTKEEVELFDNTLPLKEKRITAEACVHHMWFEDKDYEEKGTFIKWNPAVKTAADRDAILQGVLDNKIDVIATDHAPHTLEEKNNNYFNAPSGGPLVQHALVSMMEHMHNGKISMERIVEKMAHNVADMFDIEKRGYIREGYFADLVLVDPNKPWTVEKENILYKCNWSPFEGTTFQSSVKQTFVNGRSVYQDEKVIEGDTGMRLTFER